MDIWKPAHGIIILTPWITFQMPLYAVGLTEHETPFTFGSSVPPLAFTWSVNKKDVATLQSVFHKVSVSKSNLQMNDLNFCDKVTIIE